jgi:uncharacterized protein YjiK
MMMFSNLFTYFCNKQNKSPSKLHMKKLYKKWLLILSLLSIFGTYACKAPQNRFTSPKGYDLNKPEKFNMPSSLLEISGITFHRGDSKIIYSIQDEDGKLFKQHWDIKKQTNTKFAPKGDFEDLAILNEMVFVLKSNGSVYAFPISDAAKTETDQVKEYKHLLPKGEYEGMYADDANGNIYFLCKNCETDKKKPTITGYVFNYQEKTTELLSKGGFTIDLSKVAAVKGALRPSAITKHPKTGEWYIISSVQKLLLVVGPDWKVRGSHKLNSSIFNQPEGIAFDRDLNLFISNEGDELTEGNILKFKHIQ